MSITIASGLTLVVPSPGAINWDTLLFTSVFSPISSHDHTGSPNGVQIATGALADLAVTTAKIAADNVTGPKILIGNAAWLRSRNAANGADVNLIRVNSSDRIEISDNLSWQTWTPNYTQSGLMTISSTSTTSARYARVGKIIHFNINFSGTLGGTADAAVSFSPPVTAATNANPMIAFCLNGGGPFSGVVDVATSTRFDVYRYDGGAWTAAPTSCTVQASGTYEAA